MLMEQKGIKSPLGEGDCEGERDAEWGSIFKWSSFADLALTVGLTEGVTKDAISSWKRRKFSQYLTARVQKGNKIC